MDRLEALNRRAEDLGRQLAEGCPGIGIWPDGSARMGMTRIRLETIVGFADAGEDAESLGTAFGPSVTTEQVKQVLDHVRARPELLAEYMAVSDEIAEEVRARIEPRMDPAAVRRLDELVRAARAAAGG